MRYFSIDTIQFNDATGRTVSIKDKRPIPVEEINVEIPIRSDALLDEISSRENVYGAGAEDQSFRIFDANIVELTEACFDLSLIRRLKLPL